MEQDWTQGFVLTRQWREQKNGLQLIYWVHTIEGPQKLVFDQQEAVCFFDSTLEPQVRQRLGNQSGWRIKPLQLRSFSNRPVHGLYFRSQRFLQRCRDAWANEGIILWEADIRTVDRFLSERFVCGDLVFRTENESTHIRTSSAVALNLFCVSLDIETAMDGSQLYSIAVHGFGNKQGQVRRVFMLGREQDCDHIDISWYDSEKHLLDGFLQWWAQHDPDVIIGWNVVNFDLRFLQRRCDHLGMTFSIGRQSEAVEWRQARDEKNHYFILVPGRVVLDGIDTLKAATWSFESFSLEFVSRQLLQRGKLIEDVQNRGQHIGQLFNQDKLALARYNLEDCQLVSDIFDHAHLLQFAIERTRLTGLPMDKIGGSVAAFENLYLPQLHRAGFVAPNVGEMQTDITAPGGYVMESRPGLYRHVLVLDFKSLYPSIIRTFSVDPLSLIQGLSGNTRQEAVVPDIFHRGTEAPDSADKDWIPGYNGAVFSKQKHLLPEIISRLWQARDQAKLVKDKPLSQAIKIIMNSFYGVLGTPLCRFYDPRLSSSITLRGHDIMQQTRQLIEEKGYKVIYGDTDSVFVWLEGVEDIESVHPVGNQLAQFLNQWWKNQLRQVFGIESHLELEFETHYSRFFMPTMRGSDAGSKKRYAGLTSANQLVFKGLENVRTDWTPLARELQYQVCWMVFHDEDPLPYLKEKVAKMFAGELDDQLVYRKRLRRHLQQYQKNIPPHVRAAKKAQDNQRPNNSAISEAGLPGYGRGDWISYVITVNGPEPVEFASSALDYEHYFQRQLAPSVDGLLQCLGTSLQRIYQPQLDLF